MRARKHFCYAIFYRIIASPTFNFIIYLIIFCSSLTLALYRYDQSETEFAVIEALDHYYTVAFVTEMICKLIGLGPRIYFKDPFNILDAFVTLLSIADVLLFATVVSKDTDSDWLIALMALRLLRVSRMARIWKQFQSMLNQIKSSIMDTSVFTVFLFVFLFIFALLGMELFAYSIFFN